MKPQQVHQAAMPMWSARSCMSGMVGRVTTSVKRTQMPGTCGRASVLIFASRVRVGDACTIPSEYVAAQGLRG